MSQEQDGNATPFTKSRWRAGESVVYTPDEIAAYLAPVPMPDIVQLCRHIERQNKVGRVFRIDTEFANFMRKSGGRTISILVKITVYDLDGLRDKLLNAGMNSNSELVE